MYTTINAQTGGLLSLLQNRGGNEDSSVISQFSPIGSFIEGGPKGYANNYMLDSMLANMFGNKEEESYQAGGVTNLGLAGSPGVPTTIQTTPAGIGGGGGLEELIRNNPQLAAILQQLQGRASGGTVSAQGGGFMNRGEQGLEGFAVNPQGPGASTIPMPVANQFGGSYPTNVLTGQTYLPPPLAGNMFKNPSTSPTNMYADNTRPQSNYMNPAGIY